jgi:hypothetical protein
MRPSPSECNVSFSVAFGVEILSKVSESARLSNSVAVEGEEEYPRSMVEGAFLEISLKSRTRFPLFEEN